MAVNKKPQQIKIPGIIRNVSLNWTNSLFTVDDVQNKFTVDGLIAKDDEETVKAVRALLLEALRKGVEQDFLDEKITKEYLARIRRGEDIDPHEFGWPLKDGERFFEKNEKNERYRDHYVVQPASKLKPKLYDRHAKQLNPDDDTTRDMFHSGTIANLSVSAIVYSGSGLVKNGGVALWLYGVQYVNDGERFGGAAAFTALEDEDDTDTAATTADQPVDAGSDADWDAI